MKMFDLSGKTAVVMGGGGILGREMAKGLAQFGSSVCVCSLNINKASATAEECAKLGVKSKAYAVDANDKRMLEEAACEIIKDFGKIDILVNAVGGNDKNATTNDNIDIFDLDEQAVQKVINLNFMAGAFLPCKILGKKIANNTTGGVIINISSMSAFCPLTRVPAYSAAKAAVDNFTKWLAVDMAKKYGEKVRVNAIAPGFFLTEQNRFLLTDEKTGQLTFRGKTIIEHTPMGRFGNPEELIGALVWLASDASRFVTGAVIPVDGGFSAFKGV